MITEHDYFVRGTTVFNGLIDGQMNMKLVKTVTSAMYLIIFWDKIETNCLLKEIFLKTISLPFTND